MGASVDDYDGVIATGAQLIGLGAIAAFGLLIIVGLIWLLFFVPRSEQIPRNTEPARKPVSIAGLSTNTDIPLGVLFGTDDYRRLQTKPELKSTCVRLRQDRRRIALLWLGDLQRDVHLVWEFRRFLVRNGLTVTVWDEYRIGIAACLALVCLGAARIIVVTCGPFVLRRIGPNAVRPVELLSSRAAHLLVRAPAAIRTQLEQKWAAHVLTLNPA